MAHVNVAGIQVLGVYDVYQSGVVVSVRRCFDGPRGEWYSREVEGSLQGGEAAYDYGAAEGVDVGFGKRLDDDLRANAAGVSHGDGNDGPVPFDHYFFRAALFAPVPAAG